MSTRAIAWLKQKKIPFDVIHYDHEEKGAAFAARSTGFPLEQTIKTLVVDLGDKTFGLALLPGHQQLSLKRLAKAFGVKKAAMASTECRRAPDRLPRGRHQPLRTAAAASGCHGGDPSALGGRHGQCRPTRRHAEDGAGRHRQGAGVPGDVPRWLKPVHPVLNLIK